MAPPISSRKARILAESCAFQALLHLDLNAMPFTHYYQAYLLFGDRLFAQSLQDKTAFHEKLIEHMPDKDDRDAILDHRRLRRMLTGLDGVAKYGSSALLPDNDLISNEAMALLLQQTEAQFTAAITEAFTLENIRDPDFRKALALLYTNAHMQGRPELVSDAHAELESLAMITPETSQALIHAAFATFIAELEGKQPINPVEQKKPHIRQHSFKTHRDGDEKMKRIIGRDDSWLDRLHAPPPRRSIEGGRVIKFIPKDSGNAL